MPKLTPATQAARRERILDAAEHCFARTGFHRTTIADICREAGISAGALYVYFDSKEALIAGITERDRATLAGQMTELASSSDLLAALGSLGEYYAVEQPRYKQVLCLEIGAESTRNPLIADMFRSVDRFVTESMSALFDRSRAEGRIAPQLDSATIAKVLCVLGDGLFYRRAIEPDFDAREIIPILLSLVGTLLNPSPADAPLSEAHA